MLGYFFGNMPFVQNNFELVVIAIIGISLVPMIWEFAAERCARLLPVPWNDLHDPPASIRL